MEDVQQLAFNRGVISPLALARADIARVALSAEQQTNWMPRVLGPMSVRAGSAYLDSFGAQSIAIPFIFATDDVALLQVKASALVPWVGEATVDRPTVTATVSNGTFDSNLTNWTDSDESGGTSAWVTGGYMGLTGSGSAAAKRRQTVSVTETGTEHGLKIVVERGPVVLRVGSSAGDDDYINETALGTGAHHLSVTPTGDIYLEFSNRLNRQVLLDSCEIVKQYDGVDSRRPGRLPISTCCDGRNRRT